MNLTNLAKLQEQWATEVIISPHYVPQDEDVIFSLDIQYVGDTAFVALDVQRYSGELIGKVPISSPE